MVLKYDAERFLTDVEGLFKSYLNAKITSINTEKNDTVILDQVDSNAYFHDMDEKAANYSPVFLTQISNIQTNGIGPTSSQIITIDASLIFFDGNQDAFITNRMLRYQRCMKEVIEDNFYGKIYPSVIKIDQLQILSFVKSGTSLWFKMATINITGDFD